MLIAAWALALGFAALASAALAGCAAVALRVFTSASAAAGAGQRPDSAGRALAFAAGAGAFLSLSVLAGIAGGYTRGAQGALIVAGIALLWRFRDERRALLAWPRFARGDLVWLAFPAAYFLARFLSAGLPQQHNDALYYHLAAPKLWAELGRIRLVAEHPSHAQAALWEAIYGFPQLWLGTRDALARVTAQVCGQWMHMLWGQGGALLVTYALLRALVPALAGRRGLAVFLAWLCACLPCVEWTGGLAKNDYVAAFFAMSAVLALFRGGLPGMPAFGRAFACGLFAGWAFATKMSSAATALALPILVVSCARGPTRGRPVTALVAYLFGGLSAAAPVLLRNTISTGNPFFPMFDGVLGPGWVASWWHDHNASFGGMFRADPAMIPWIWSRLFEKALPKVLLVVGTAGAAAAWASSLRRAGSNADSGAFRQRGQAEFPVAVWAAFLAVQLALLVMSLRPAADGRYGGYVLTLILLTLLAPALRWMLAGAVSAARAAAFYALLPLGLLVNSPLDLAVKVPRDYWFAPAARYVDRFHAYQEVKNWMNAYVRDADPRRRTVVAIADKANFHLDPPFETFTEMRKWEDVLAASPDARGFLARARALGYRYVFLQTHFVYPPSIRGIWDELQRLAPALTAFRAQDTLVLDLDRL